VQDVRRACRQGSACTRSWALFSNELKTGTLLHGVAF